MHDNKLWDIYPQYWRKTRVEVALKKGTIFRATFKKSHQGSQGYATLHNSSIEVLIDGPNQNRAIDGDVVAVQVDDANKWFRSQYGLLDYHSDQDLEHLKNCLKETPNRTPTGQVVSILKKSPQRNALFGFVKGMAFLPINGGLQSTALDITEIPTLIQSKFRRQPSSSIREQLVSACIKHWHADERLPHVQVMKVIGSASDINVYTKAVLSTYGIQSLGEFSFKVMACIPKEPSTWQVPFEEYKKRRDLRATRVFSIDPETAKDMDDALSIEVLCNNLVRVGVHIADVSYFVQPGSALDKEAKERSTTVYTLQQVIPMLPAALSEELCSLNPGVDRLALSLIWDLDDSGKVMHQWAGRTVIRSCCKLTYKNAQDMIDGVFDGSSQVGLPGAFSWKEVAEDVRSLQSVAKALRSRRFNLNGALKLDNPKLKLILDEHGNPCNNYICSQQESNLLVEEFMLLANTTVAKVISDAFPKSALLRRHPEPRALRLNHLQRLWEGQGFNLDVSSAATINSSLQQLRVCLREHDPELINAFQLLTTKTMRRAEYFCTGNITDEAEWRHYALAAPVYTHFTSPIRRYPDIVVHRMLLLALQGKQTHQDEHTTTREISQVAAQSNQRRMATTSAEEAVDRLYLWHLLRKKQGLLSNAYVVGLGPEYLIVYVSELAMERRIDLWSVQVQWSNGTLVIEQPTSSSTSELFSHVDLKDEQSSSGCSSSSSSNIQPEILPLTLRMFSRIPVLVHATGGEGKPFNIEANLYLTK